MNDLGWTRKGYATPQVLINLLHKEAQIWPQTLLLIWLQDSDRLQQMGQERSSLQRQMRQVQERVSLASSQQQVEEAASSLTTLENLLQVCCLCVAVSLIGTVRLGAIKTYSIALFSLLWCIVQRQV